MTSSYPKILRVDHRDLRDRLFVGPVVVQEKVDGSQVTFWLDPITAAPRMRSKGAEVCLEKPQKLFSVAAATVTELGKRRLLDPRAIYRGEAFHAPCHNAIAYERCPEGGIVLFDVELGDGTCDYQTPEDVRAEADRLGLEPVTTYHEGEIDAGGLASFMGRKSALGGAAAEGVVVKNYGQLMPDGKPALGKLVREEFKEVNARAHAKVGRGDFVEALGEEFRLEARWAKAVQRLAETGELLGAPQDIPRLLVEAKADLEAEEAQAIKDRLYAEFRKKILACSVRGLPEWYKGTLFQP